MKMNATERTERREQIKATKAHLETVVEVFKATREETPAATVAELVTRLGYETAREAVAELVNTVGAWDGRIYEYVREWAQSVETAATREELEAYSIYQPGDIHPAHINQIGEAMREYTPAEEIPAEEAQEAAEEAQQESTLDKVSAELEAHKDRSAWGRGVNAYALELVEELKERAAYEGRSPEPGKECREWMLNGARDWELYSWGGSSLIYDDDIAERLCTPSELKKTRHGERRPNSREEWLDTQARALAQACNRVARVYRSIVNG